jgi:hypothetical protein
MKFHYVDIKAVKQFIPPWSIDYMLFARELDECLDKYAVEVWKGHKPVPFMIDVELENNAIEFRISESKDPNDPDQEMGMLIFYTREGMWEIGIPLIHLLKDGNTPAPGSYCLYSHGIGTQTPLGYVGITSRPWFVRYAEHQTAARSGSRFLFHDALRTHAGKYRISHRILDANLTKDQAMRREEEWVAARSLYPLGLNMIPGGYAGLRYLSTLSVQLRDSEYTAESIASAMERESIAGKPNPLCAARWQSDPDYVARVICGHHGRLTVEQVRMIRTLGITCRPPNEIAEFAKAKLSQVKRLLSNLTYSRIR